MKQSTIYRLAITLLMSVLIAAACVIVRQRHDIERLRAQRIYDRTGASIYKFACEQEYSLREELQRQLQTAHKGKKSLYRPDRSLPPESVCRTQQIVLESSYEAHLAAPYDK